MDNMAADLVSTSSLMDDVAADSATGIINSGWCGGWIIVVWKWHKS